MKNQDFKDRIGVPVTKDMKDKFQEACYWNRTTMAEEIRLFISRYKTKTYSSSEN